MALQIHRLDTNQADFDERLTRLLAWESVSDNSVQQTVQDIVNNVRTQGDEALLQYSCQFDRLDVKDASQLVVTKERLQQAYDAITDAEREALIVAANRVKTYHQHQKQETWTYEEADGTLLGQQITALDRVGIYVPGGKASYPSSVLMNAIPAKVAGVKDVIMVVPTPGGEVNDMVFAAAVIAGVDKVITVGGAQAVAALAYGTETVPAVDKVVGPGNIYVATAKRMVFGQVGIDMIAGPSEIMIVCDGKTDPDWIAMDLFSQAEHDEDAQSILVSPDAAFLKAVEASLEKLLPTLERSSIAEQSLKARGALIQVSDMDEAVDMINRIAPEHLELSVEDPLAMSKRVRHAGAIFMGRYLYGALYR